MSRDRFTEKDENGKWMTEMLPHERRNYIHRHDSTDAIDKDYLYGPAIERLAAYEDLIFSPEVLQAIIKEWKELADAKNDGRLVILSDELRAEFDARGWRHEQSGFNFHPSQMV